MKTYILAHADFQLLLDELINQKYEIIGPTMTDHAIVYENIESVSELPIGWIEEQEKGHYRLKQVKAPTLFGFTIGPTSWKRYLYPPQSSLWKALKTDSGFKVSQDKGKIPKYAFLGVRACELEAIKIQDRVFINETYQDPIYKGRREQAFIIALNCSRASQTCFCVSMNSGPQVKHSFDLALTELYEHENHRFLIEVGSEKGHEVLNRIPHTQASKSDLLLAQKIIDNTSQQMGRQMNTKGLKEHLDNHRQHPLWKELGERCMSCTNCTMVCPTCFCSTVEDITDLSGQQAERIRRWDSCFNDDFSYIHGGTIRQSISSRYRHWLTHKLSSWHDQFDTSGCVGCGRCISWCPVGIDLTEEVQKLRSGE